MRSTQILQAFIKSGRGHGEGSRGGHVIGHTRNGRPIYAHGSAAKEHIKQLADGDTYDLHHFVHGPPSQDEHHLEDHLHALPGAQLDAKYYHGAVPLGNGHFLAFKKELVDAGEAGGRREVYPGQNEVHMYDDPGEPPEFDTSHDLIDASGKVVEGAKLSPRLQEMADNTSERFNEHAVENFDPREHALDDDRDEW